MKVLQLIFVGKRKKETEEVIRSIYDKESVSYVKEDIGEIVEYIKEKASPLYFHPLNIGGFNTSLQLFLNMEQCSFTHKRVDFISFDNRILKDVEYEFCQIIHKELYQKGAFIYLDKYLDYSLLKKLKDERATVLIFENESNITLSEDLSLWKLGVGQEQCENEKKPYDFTLNIFSYSGKDARNYVPLFIKIIFHKETGRILGIHGIGSGNLMDFFEEGSKVLMADASILNMMDYIRVNKDNVYLGEVYNYSNLVARRIFQNDFRQISLSQIKKLWREGGFFLDVREVEEYESGHIKGALNIPMRQVKSRLKEIPKDRPIYIYCRSAQRSYIVLKVLEAVGYKNLYNVSGSFLGLCYYEFFMNKAYLQNRETIVTEYNCT